MSEKKEMTREEAIEIFEQKGWWIAQKETFTSKQAEEIIKLNDAVNFALSALRPISREQVEEVYPACDVCGGGKEIRSDNFCGMARLRIVGDSINLRGDEKKIKSFGHIYAPSFSVRFCPFCGKPLTDEAVDMMLERWKEALENG